jgi:hypothetical protein
MNFGGRQLVDECYDSKLREAKGDDEEDHRSVFTLHSYQHSRPDTRAEVGNYFEVRLNLISVQGRNRCAKAVVSLQ